MIPKFKIQNGGFNMTDRLTKFHKQIENCLSYWNYQLSFWIL